MFAYCVGMIGLFVFSMSGALAAGRKGYDLMGVVVISVVTALGGGTLRDLLMGGHPIFWINDPNQLWVVLGGAGLTVIYVRRFKPPDAALLVADALGLAVFTIAGAQMAETRGLSSLIVVAMGAITGAAGGVLRDVLTGEIPLLFRATEPLYATAAILGTTGYLVAQQLGLGRTEAALGGITIVAILRFLAIFVGLYLPALRLPPPEHNIAPRRGQ